MYIFAKESLYLIAQHILSINMLVFLYKFYYTIVPKKGCETYMGL